MPTILAYLPHHLFEPAPAATSSLVRAGSVTEARSPTALSSAGISERSGEVVFDAPVQMKAGRLALPAGTPAVERVTGREGPHRA